MMNHFKASMGDIAIFKIMDTLGVANGQQEKPGEKKIVGLD